METTLITGASSGIGKSLAALFARGGSNLVLVARSQAKLEKLAKQLQAEHKITVWVEPADLSRPGAAKKLAASFARQDIEVDILVNNAGVLEHGRFIDIGTQAHRRMLDLNISGLTEMLDYFLPAMVERGSGRVLNVASIASFQPIPSLAIYAASKAFVLSLTESLAEELKGSGVSITALCPGITATNMVSTAQENSGGLNIPDFLIGDVDDVAADGYKACMKGEVIVVPGAMNLAAILAGRAIPKWLLRRITGVAGRYTTDN
ncbi:SDR family NAD(P)-dependent oxidoreductase [Zhongshania sp.]|uniref:SDR family NAD(P)-dependent oxidoreductase n=1 Tax=Zhongshania sp. TaxID=1971902 RepID=UPI003566BDC6